MLDVGYTETPDVELMVTTFLRVVLGSEVGSVATERPDPNSLPSSLPLVLVTSLGGPGMPHPYGVDLCRVDIDVWASSKYTANQTIGKVRAALASMKGYKLGEATVFQTGEEQRPAKRPEPNPSLHRVGMIALVNLAF